MSDQSTNARRFESYVLIASIPELDAYAGDVVTVDAIGNAAITRLLPAGTSDLLARHTAQLRPLLGASRFDVAGGAGPERSGLTAIKGGCKAPTGTRRRSDRPVLKLER
jgi:hypothetical protein